MTEELLTKALELFTLSLSKGELVEGENGAKGAISIAYNPL